MESVTNQRDNQTTETNENVKVKIKKIGVLSLGINFLIANIIFGFISGLLFVILISQFASLQIPFLESLTVIGYLSLIIFPVLGAICGFITGIIIALIYNLVLKITGGLKITLKEI